MVQASEDAKAPQYLSITVAGTDYGLPILAVKEILQLDEITHVPGAPPSIRGVVNVRGRVVPVVDLAVKLGRSASVPSMRTCILVVETAAGTERLTLGILADAVNEVVDLPLAEIEEAPAFGGDVRVEYLTGVGKIGKRFLLLLDPDRVLCAADPARAAQPAAADTAATEGRPSPAAPADPAQGGGAVARVS